MATENHYYYVIYSNTRRYIAAGLRPQIVEESGGEIVEGTWWELSHRDGKPELNAGKLGCSWLRTRDWDGRLFKIYQADENGTAEFIETAGEYGIADEARNLAELLNA